MSRHVPRRDRWASQGPDRYRSLEGLVVRRYRGEWWADVAYALLVSKPDEPAAWETHLDTLGPFKRPRNAMVEAERHVTLLRNRHGEALRLEEPSSRGPGW